MQVTHHDIAKDISAGIGVVSAGIGVVSAGIGVVSAFIGAFKDSGPHHPPNSTS